MDELAALAATFETHRSRLYHLAHRLLGSETAAEDAVQEAWLRLARADASDIDNLGGWLTTVVSRVCVRMGATAEVGGAVAVAETFKGRALGAELMLVDGNAALVWAAGGQVRVVFIFTVAGNTIARIDLVADPERIGQFDIRPASEVRGA